MRDWLGRKLIQIADFYRTVEQPTGERLHLIEAARVYPDTTAGAEATARLAEAGDGELAGPQLPGGRP